MSPTTRTLIVNADDFGLSRGINEGIERAFLDGVVTSASLMVRQPAAGDAGAFSRAHPSLSVGLHVDLGEWVYRRGEWAARYEVVDLTDRSAIRREIDAQLRTFRELTGREPTHLDSHQHVHHSEPVCRVIEEEAGTLGIPVRGFAWGGFGPRVRHCGDFYGQSGTGSPEPRLISVEYLLELIDRLPSGWTELGCHPGDGSAGGSVYASERAVEVRTLTDARVRDGLAAAGVELASFHDHRRLSRDTRFISEVA